MATLAELQAEKARRSPPALDQLVAERGRRQGLDVPTLPGAPGDVSEQPTQEQSFLDKAIPVLKQAAAVPLEFAAGVNRSAIGIIDFFGPDQVNAFLEQTGSEKRVPTLAGTEIGQAATAGGFLDEGLARDIISAAGEISTAALAPQQFIRGAAAQLPRVAGGESVLSGAIRQAGQQTLPQAAKVGVAVGAGTALGGEAGEQLGGPEGREIGEALGGIALPVAIAGATQLGRTVQRVAKADISPAARETIEAAEKKGLDILTTDVIPPETFAGKSVQQLGEKLGALGTGARRATQQKARVNIVEEIAQDFGLALDTPLEATIVKNIEKGVAQRLSKAADIRQEAVQSLDKFGDVDVKKITDAIDIQLSRQSRLRGEADSSTVSKLRSLRDSLSSKQVIDPVTQTRVTKETTDFSFVKDLRSNLIDDVNAAFRGEALPTKAVAPLQAVKKSFDNTLLGFAKENDRSAAAKWLKSNRLFADSLRKVKETELKRLLIKGTQSPESVATILKGGKISELNRIFKFAGPEGREAAKASIVRDALTESGFFTGNVNPDRFITALNRPARQKAIGVFFKGNAKKEIEGITRILDATRRAQQASVSTATGQQLIPLVATGGVGAGLVTNPLVTFFTGSTLIAATKGYESKAVRTMLLRLANSKPGSKAEGEILSNVVPIITGLSQTAGEQQ